MYIASSQAVGPLHYPCSISCSLQGSIFAFLTIKFRDLLGFESHLLMENMSVQRFHIFLRILLLGNPEGKDTESLGFQSHGQSCFGLSKGLVKAERFSFQVSLKNQLRCSSVNVSLEHLGSTTSLWLVFICIIRGRKRSPSSQSVILVRIEPVEVLSTEQ